MPSSLSASTISFFRSSSSLSTTESFRIILFDATHQFSHSQRPVFAIHGAPCVQAISYLDTEQRATRRNYPPVLPFNKRWRFACNRDELNAGLQKRGDIGKTAMQVHWLARYGASSLRENNQAVAVRECRPASREHVVEFEVVTDVTGAANQATEIGTFPEFLLDDALRSTDQRHQQHDIQQRWMVCDDKPSGAVLESFRSGHLEVDQAQKLQHADVSAKQDVDQKLVALTPPPARRRGQMDDRECGQCQQRASSEERSKGDAGAGQTPDIVQAVKRHGAKSRSCAHLPTLRTARPRAGSGENRSEPRSMAAHRFALGQRRPRWHRLPQPAPAMPKPRRAADRCRLRRTRRIRPAAAHRQKRAAQAHSAARRRARQLP